MSKKNEERYVPNLITIIFMIIVTLFTFRTIIISYQEDSRIRSEMAKKFKLFKEEIIEQSPSYTAIIVSYFPIVDDHENYWIFHVDDIGNAEIASPIKIEESEIKFNYDSEVDNATMEFNYVTETIPFPEYDGFRVYKGMYNIVVTLPK